MFAQQNAPALDQPRGYVRMAVMDGKTIGHRVSSKLRESDPCFTIKI